MMLKASQAATSTKHELTGEECTSSEREKRADIKHASVLVARPVRARTDIDRKSHDSGVVVVAADCIRIIGTNGLTNQKDVQKN